MMPGNAKRRRVDLDSRLRKAAAASEESPFSVEEIRDPAVGVVTSGVAYQYVREALPSASTLKLGVTYPLPMQRIRQFAGRVHDLYVVEELDPYLLESLRAAGVSVKDTAVPHIGELSPTIVAEAFGKPALPIREPLLDLPDRPPMLCAGCPHRGVFRALREMSATVVGDIGCYTLAALPPLAAMDSCLCMGASIGMARGFQLGSVADAPSPGPVVAVIGDSTFAHSGMTGLLEMTYNGGDATVVILDNRVTAMTGHQDNPFTGRTLSGEPAPEIDIEGIVRALGVSDVATVDPNLLRPTEKALRTAAQAPGVSVVISRAPCIMLSRERGEPFTVDAERCNACGECVRLGCPAISRGEHSRATIDAAACAGCRQCVQVCKVGAIKKVVADAECAR
jgi:indolepyruvate ferredoxin oxidoreductase alpha subunit